MFILLAPWYHFRLYGIVSFVKGIVGNFVFYGVVQDDAIIKEVIIDDVFGGDN